MSFKDGTYAQYCTAKADTCAKIPDNVSFEDAAACPVAAYTAYEALTTKANVQKDEYVVIIGASGGVGSYAVKIAKHLGAKVIAVCSTMKIGYCTKSLLADHAIDYTKEDVKAKVLEYTGGLGAHVVFNCVASVPEDAHLVRMNGRLCNITG